MKKWLSLPTPLLGIDISGRFARIHSMEGSLVLEPVHPARPTGTVGAGVSDRASPHTIMEAKGKFSSLCGDAH